MKFLPAFLIALILASTASAQIAPGSVDMHWDEGAADCTTHHAPPLQVHAYNKDTFILRETPCATFEAPFMYLLIGRTRALLIDTGDVADAKAMPLAKTVMGLLPRGLPLLVVHTHRHLDHRAGDAQFANLAHILVTGYDLDSVKRFYGFPDWPNGLAHVDLGGRVVDVFPIPGHSETHVAFYDRKTALFFSGDFLMPARLLIEDASADLASANRTAAFVKDRSVAYVLGGHIEMNSAGELFPWETTYHPHEHVLAMSKTDVLALPAAVAQFNGFYSQVGPFTFMNSLRMLYLFSAGVLIVLIVLVLGIVLFFRRRRQRVTRAPTRE